MIGGVVRDHLLGRERKDIDLVVQGVEPEALRAWLEQHGSVDYVGRDFGVYKFWPHASGVKQAVDIALPRSERSTEQQGGYRDVRVQTDPSLAIETDLARRDFTVNAIAYDLRDRRLVDPFGGQKDLETRLIRAVGNPRERFSEDLSRVLRAIRFAAELDFKIEDETWNALVKTIPDIHRTRPGKDGQVEYVVPRETLGKELGRALTADPIKTLTLFERAGALNGLFPNISHPLSPETLSHIATATSQDPHVTLALLLRSYVPVSIRRQIRNLGLQTLSHGDPAHVDPEQVAWIIEQERRIEQTDPKSMPAVKLEDLFLTERGQRYLTFLEAAGHEAYTKQIRSRLAAIFEHCGTSPNEKIPLLVSGRDVIARIPPGPLVRTLLRNVRNVQLEGQITSREEALTYLDAEITRLTAKN